MKKQLSLIVLTTATPLTGCVSFLPNYDQAIYKRLESAVTDIDKVGTSVAIPYRKLSFNEIEPHYTSALSSLYSAESLAEGRSQSYRGRLPGRSAKIVTTAIGNCRLALEAFRELHRTTGVNAQDFRDSAVVRTCTIPKMMEERLKGN